MRPGTWGSRFDLPLWTVLSEPQATSLKPQASAMVVALLTADTSNFLASWGSTSQLSPTDVTAFTFLLFLLWLVFYGAGKLSLDALLRRILHSEPTPIGSLSPESP